MPDLGDERRPGTRPLDPLMTAGAGVMRAVIRDEHGTELWACEHGHMVSAQALACADRAMRDAGWVAPPEPEVEQPDLFDTPSNAG